MPVMIKDKIRATQEVYYFDKDDFLFAYNKIENYIGLFLFFSVVFFFISPFISLFLIFWIFILFYKGISKKFFNHPTLVDFYYKLFSPRLGEKVLSVIGYEIPPSKLESHLSIIDKPQELLKKQKIYEQKKESWVGIPINKFRTHFIVPGQSGAGKTEAVRSMTNDVIKIGGGTIFNDGKSDEKMLIEVATQAKENNRETSFRVLNFLKPEKMSETNTINLVGAMHPLKTVQLFGELASGGGATQADATYKHFENLAKAMLFCPLNCLSIKRDLYEEPFDLEKVRESTDIKELVSLYIHFYGICRDLNEILENNKKIQKMLTGFNIPIKDKHFQTLHNLVYYITQNPIEKTQVEKILKIQYRYIKEIYKNALLPTGQYLNEIWNGYSFFLPKVANFFYYYVKSQKEYFFKLDPKNRGLKYIDFLINYYYKIKEIILTEQEKLKIVAGEIISEFGEVITPNDIEILIKAFTRPKMQGGNIEDIPDDAIQQHQYATQHWTSLFNTLSKFTHIFGQSHSEIIPRKVLLDNQILYNLIPVTELDKEEVQIVGKIAIAIINQVASVALGGEKISEHLTIKNIMKDKNRPKPIYIAFLDEYNSYPIEGVDVMFLQYRSLNIGMILGIQNLAGLKVGGTDETSKENALGSATKMFMKSSDVSTIEWLEKMMIKTKTAVAEKMVNINDNIENTSNVRIEEEEIFKPQLLQQFANGLGVIVDENITIVQNFYRGGKSETIKLTHLIPLEI